MMALRDHGTSGFLAEFGATPVARRHILRTPDIRRVGFSGKTLTSGSCRFPNVMPASRSFPTTLRRVPTAESASGRVRIPPSPPCVSSPSPARWLTRSSPVFISSLPLNASLDAHGVRRFPSAMDRIRRMPGSVRRGFCFVWLGQWQPRSASAFLNRNIRGNSGDV